MGLFDFLKGKPPWEMEKQKRTEFERRMAKSGYELAELQRQKSLLQRRHEIASLRMNIQELRPSPSPLAGFRDVFRRRSLLESEERMNRALDRRLTRARKATEIAKLAPKPMQSSGQPSYGGVMDALNIDPFNPPKKKR